MHIPSNNPLLPRPNNFENQQEEASREVTVVQNQLQALPINEGPSSLTGREITLIDSASAASDIASELLKEELQDCACNKGYLENATMHVKGHLTNTPSINHHDRQRIFQKRLQELEKINGKYKPDLRKALLKDINTKELNIYSDTTINLDNLLSYLTNLTTLTVTGDFNITKLGNHPSLKVLQLGIFTTFPEWVRNCHNIEKIEINTEDPFDLPEWIGELTNLKYLCIDGPLTHLPRSIGQLAQLDSLMLCNAEIEELPDELVNCRALKTLTIDSCLITKLPQGIFSLPLKGLELDFCEFLEMLPDGIEHCSTLENISLTHLDSLKELPSGLDKLHNLVEFRFYSNNDVLLPASVFSAPNLNRFECTHRDIEAIEVTDFLFDGLLEHEKALVLQRSAQLLEVLKASDEDADYHDLLTQSDIVDDSGNTPQVIGLRCRFASHIWKRYLEIERIELENEARSLSIMHSILNLRYDDPSRPLSEELSYLYTALRAAVIPDTALKLRKVKKRILEISV